MLSKNLNTIINIIVSWNLKLYAIKLKGVSTGLTRLVKTSVLDNSLYCLVLSISDNIIKELLGGIGYV